MTDGGYSTAFVGQKTVGVSAIALVAAAIMYRSRRR